MVNQTESTITPKHKKARIQTIFMLLSVPSFIGWTYGITPSLFANDGPIILLALMLYIIPMSMYGVAYVTLRLLNVKPIVQKKMQTNMCIMTILPGLIVTALSLPGILVTTILTIIVWLVFDIRQRHAA